MRNDLSEHINGHCHLQTILHQYMQKCIDVYYFADANTVIQKLASTKLHTSIYTCINWQ